MNFVKAAVYQQKFTEEGATEREVDTRDAGEKEEERRLKALPEFCKDPHFKSLAEQLDEQKDLEIQGDEDGETGNPDEKAYPYAPPKVSEEEFQYFKNIENSKRRLVRQREKEEDNELQAFRQLKAQLHFGGGSKSSESTAVVIIPTPTEGEDDQHVVGKETVSKVESLKSLKDPRTSSSSNKRQRSTPDEQCSAPPRHSSNSILTSVRAACPPKVIVKKRKGTIESSPAAPTTSTSAAIPLYTSELQSSSHSDTAESCIATTATMSIEAEASLSQEKHRMKSNQVSSLSLVGYGDDSDDEGESG